MLHRVNATTRHLLAALVAGCILAPTVVRAESDSIRFPNGERLVGTLIGEEDDTYIFRSQFLGELRINRSEATLERAPEGDPVEPPETTPTTTPEPVVAADAGTILEDTLPDVADDVAEQSGEPEISAAERVDQFLEALAANPAVMAIGKAWPFKQWRSTMNVAMKWQSGALNRDDVNVRFDSRREFGGGNARVDVSYDYATRDEGQRKVDDRLQSRLRMRFDRSDRIFLQSFSRYRNDLVKDIDMDIEQSLGIGWRFLQREAMSASITPSATAAYRQINGIDEEWNYLATLFQDFQLTLTDKISFHEELNFSYSPRQSDDWNVDFLARVQTDLTKTIAANVRWEVEYDGSVQPNQEESQERLIFTLGLKF